jgi:DHA3 family macrolide efflux protein-like MFS transporter
MHMKDETAKRLPASLFTMFWAAQAVSLFGDRLNSFSLMAIINSFADNPSMTLSKFYLAMSLPLFLLAPLIGAFVDRYDKRWILVITDLFRGALVFLIPVLFMRTGHFFPVMVVVFILSTGNLFFLPAKSALIPELVSTERLVHVNSILWAAGIAGVIGGFLGGGIIFDFFSWPACFYLDGASYFISASLILGIALQGRKEAAHETKEKTYHPELPRAILDGIRAIRNSPAMLRPLGVQTLLFVGGGGFSVVALPLVKAESREGSSLGLSAVGLSLGLGMGLGSLLASRLKLSSNHREKFEIGLFALFIPAVVTIFFGHGLTSILVGAFLAGLGAAPLIIVAESELQSESHESMRGRVFAFREIVTKSFFIASAFLFSSLGGVVRKNTLLLVLGLVLACLGMIWISIASKRSGGLVRPGGGDGGFRCR